MSKENTTMELHCCACAACREHPYGITAQHHRAINRLVAWADEHRRRQLVALLAQQQGYGGISLMSRVTGLDRNTIGADCANSAATTGLLLAASAMPALGASRSRPPSRGVEGLGPFAPRCHGWRSYDRLAVDAPLDAETGQGPAPPGDQGVPQHHRALLHDAGFSLRTNRKQLAEVTDPDRDRQFRYLTRLRRLYISRGLPVISVDTKKKELIGPYKNPGKTWRRKPQVVFAHDFSSYAVGKAVPYGIYDPAYNDGLVVVGTSHETPTFAVACIRRWWLMRGRKRYAGAKRLLIQADAGGANDYRKWEWKVALQKLADEFDLVITVTHYPPGASKWNPIDHRMFSLISGNWAGEPLVSYEKMLKHIRRTRSTTGFHCRAVLDTQEYPTGWKVRPADKAWTRLKPRSVLPDWNYSIWPHRHHPGC